MKNTLGDLNNHLFAQLERLTDEDLSNEKLDMEISRSREVTRIASQIINAGQLVLKAQQFNDDKMDADSKIPRMLEG